jgi:hypothetical protein
MRASTVGLSNAFASFAVLSAGNIRIRVTHLAKKEKERLEEEARRKKEAEKPRVMVDVYRGDKHVQELFR